MRCAMIWILLLVPCSVLGSPYVYDSSYAYMRLHNRNSGSMHTYCVNYQQWQSRELPATPELASWLNFTWYGAAYTYEACGRPSHDLSGLVVPAEYRLTTNKSRACPLFPGDHGWEKEFPYQVANIERNGAAAALFLVDKGYRYLSGFRDFLFSDFRNVYVNDSATAMPVFYWYDQAWQTVFITGGNLTNFSAAFYRPPTLRIEWAMVIIFCISEFCIVVGGVASGKRRFDLLAVGAHIWGLFWCDEVARNQRRALKIQKIEEKLARAEDRKRTQEEQRLQNGVLNPAETDGGNDDVASTSGLNAAANGTAAAGSDQEDLNPPSTSSDRAAADDSRRNSQDNESHATPFTWVSLVVMVVFVVGLLLLAYYFRSVMVWLFIVVFMWGGACALFSCLSALAAPFPCAKCRVCMSPRDVTQSMFRRELCPSWQLCDVTPTWLSIVIMLISAAVPVVWCVFRNATWGFILQDVISACFCIHFMKGLRMPSLKSTSILLICMLVYDLVMVFVTPFLTKNGCSVMVEVATGAGCVRPNARSQPLPPVDAHVPESIPILFKVPRLSDPMLPCYDMAVELQYKPMILGMGDVMLPGLLVSYCFGADFLLSTRCYVYGVVACIAYGVGLVVTFIALSVMQMAQPALIYLVPFCLVPVYVTALCRRELGILWTGDLVSDDLLETTPINQQPPADQQTPR